MDHKEIAILPLLYDTLLWYARKLGQYPRVFRYNIGERSLQGLMNVLELIIESRYASGPKSHLLQKANIELEKVRFLVRLSKDLQCISLAEYEHAAMKLVELGKMAGGWEKYSRRKEGSDEA